MRYKSFMMRICNLFCIVFLLFGYNCLLKYRKQEEENQQLRQKVTMYEAERENANEKEDGQEKSKTVYADGTYEGEGNGFGGGIQVEVTIKNGTIADINIISAKQEDKAYLDMAKKMLDDILEKQTVEIDTISGATYSSTGIKNAVAQALEKAVQ